MESVGIPVKRRFLEKDAVPTIHFRDSDAQELPGSSMSPVVSTPVAILPLTPCPRPMTCSTPKKPRRAFQKREIMLDFEKAVEQPIVSSDIQDELVMEPVQEVMCTDAEDHSPQNSIQVHEEISSAPVKETRSVGSQLSMMKPQRRSHYTQTKWKGYDKDTQTVNSQEKRDVGVPCNLLKAPPLEFKASRKAEDQHPEESSFSLDETESILDDSLDVTLELDLMDEFDESLENDQSPEGERKFIVYEKNLMCLFNSCPSCVKPAYAELQQVRGTMISIMQECEFCKFQRTWKSQLELSSAILFSGALPAKILRLFSFIHVACISYRTFMAHQKYYLHPAVLDFWTATQSAHLQTILENDKAIHLGGDGRADTPGHSAKFGCYTLMDLQQKKVVDIQLVQSNKVKGSCHMEKEGLIRGIKYLQGKNIKISHIVTDRHLQVAKWLRENLPEVRHNIDVWHVAKGLKKKLVTLSQDRECRDLEKWIRSIVNHLYWVPSASPDSTNPSMRWQKWMSIMNHVQNVHSGHGPDFPKCAHDALGSDVRNKRWLQPGTKVMEKLECLVKSNQMKRDIPMLSPVLQTCSLEAYHSVVNHFAPKMYSFSYPGMQSRLILAALHFNENSSKEQATTREGDLQYKIAFPKQKKGDFTVKKVKTKSTYGYVEILQKEVVELATRRTMPQCDDTTVAPPPLCEQFFHPEKDDAVSQMHTRYGNG